MEKSDEKKPITQKEALNGCAGCLNIGCLPFVLFIFVAVVNYF